MSYFLDWFDPVVAAGVAPTITLVSPSDFDDDYDVAQSQPVVIDVIASSGISTVVILVQGAGFTGQQVVYNGAFVSPFGSGSRTTITDGYRFSFAPGGGWQPGELDIAVIAANTGGVDTETFSWEVDSPEEGDDLSASPFRDSVWRWRRRLHRQKCSVISVAIDDAYTSGPGFVLNAIALELGRKPGLDRVAWRAGTGTSPHGTSGLSDGTGF